MSKYYLQVIVEVPNNVLVNEAKHYISTELKAAGGQLHPDNTLFYGLEVISMKRLEVKSDG